jgi:predicted PurR-regulated permease PerM
VAIVIAALYFLYAVRSILAPFVLAWVIAIVLEPVIRKLRMRGVSRPRAVVGITVVFFAVAIFLIVQLVPVVSRQTQDVAIQLTNVADQLAEEDRSQNYFLRWNPAARTSAPGVLGYTDQLFAEVRPLLESLNLPTSRREIQQQYLTGNEAQIGQTIQQFVSNLLGALTTIASQALLLLFTPIFAFLLLLDMEKFKRKSKAWIPPVIRQDTLSLLDEIGDVFTGYLRGISVSVTLFAALNAILLSVLGVPYGVLVGLIAGVLSIIPFIGAIGTTIAVIAVIVVNGETGNWMFSVGSPWLYAVIIAAIVMMFGNFYDQLIYPRIVGKRVGLNPLLAIFVVFAGGALFGILGAIIAFPLAGAIKVVLEKLMRATSGPVSEKVSLPAIPLRHRQT